MSPWKVLGWLFVALFCLLLTAGAYGLRSEEHTSELQSH